MSDAREFDQEIETHLQLLAERYVRHGMPPEEARQAALRQFGNRTLLKETRREMGRWVWLETVWQDVRYGLRGLKRNPAFTAVAITMLALGVGANTAIFGVVKAVLLDPLPFAQPGRLVAITEPSPDKPEHPDLTYRTVEELRRHSRVFDSVAGNLDASRTLIEDGVAEQIRGQRVTSNFFSTLGVHMQFGRDFLPDEDRAEQPGFVIFSHRLWVRRFGADPRVIGRVLQLSNVDMRVIGVLPPEFEPLIKGTSELVPEMYIPLCVGRGASVRVVARLKPRITLEQAQAEVDSLTPAITQDFPREHERGARLLLIPLHERLFGRAAAALWCVWGAVAFILLMACANMANLLLARASARAKEMALRRALGASRARLIRQLLVESLLIGVAGGVAGLALAWLGTGALAALIPRQIPRADRTRLDLSVLLFGLAAGVATGLLFGVAPAFRATCIGARPRNRLRNALTVAEVALAFVLALGAGLMSRSFLRLMNVNAGYDAHNVLTLTTNLWSSRYWRTADAGFAYYRQALERIRAIPGVEDAAFTSLIPMDYTDRDRLNTGDHPVANLADAALASNYSVSQEYFRVMRIPLKRGRVFTQQDSPTSPPVAVINESCARSQFPGQDPIGKRIQFWGKPWMIVVGVVGDVRQNGLDRAPELEVYVAQTQELTMGFYRLVARTTGDPMRFERAVRDAFMSLDKTQPVYHVKPLEGYLAGTLADRTLATALLGLFGALALLLAAVGIYGVVSYSVARRTREIGIRMALGAGRGSVLSTVLRHSLALTAAGIAIGYAASLLLTRMLAGLLFQVSPTDLATSAAVALALASIALVASGVPARRAATVSPMVALREE